MFLDIIHLFRLYSPTIVWNDQGSISGRGKGFVFSPQRPNRLLAPTPISYSVVTGGSFPGCEVIGPEAEYSPPTSAEVKNGEAIVQLPPYVFMAWRLII
jgi:hypothetical protein